MTRAITQAPSLHIYISAGCGDSHSRRVHRTSTRDSRCQRTPPLSCTQRPRRFRQNCMMCMASILTIRVAQSRILCVWSSMYSYGAIVAGRGILLRNNDLLWSVEVFRRIICIVSHRVGALFWECGRRGLLRCSGAWNRFDAWGVLIGIELCVSCRCNTGEEFWM